MKPDIKFLIDKYYLLTLGMSYRGKNCNRKQLLDYAWELSPGLFYFVAGRGIVPKTLSKRLRKNIICMMILERN